MASAYHCILEMEKMFPRGVTRQPSLHIKIVSREEAGGRIERWARDRKEDRDAEGGG